MCKDQPEIFFFRKAILAMLPRQSFIKPLLGLTTTTIACLVAAAPSLSATLFFTTQRTAINSDDQLNWASLGPVTPPQPFKVLPFAFTATSEDGLPINVTVPPSGNPRITPPLLFQTTATGIPTNFAANDFVLFTGLFPGVFPSPGNPGPLTLHFANPVGGAGAQIAVDDTFQFTAFISAFDPAGNLL